MGRELERRGISCALVYGANRSGELLLVAEHGAEHLHACPQGLQQVT